MKTYKELAIETIKTENVKLIKEKVQSLYCYSERIGESVNNIGIEILRMVVENSNDFTKDIAEKKLSAIDSANPTGYDFDIELSEKQAWAVAYQIKNNTNIYTI